MFSTTARQYAVITGGSSGIGFELARQFLAHDFDVLIAADRDVSEAARLLQSSASEAVVDAVSVDLSTHEGVQKLYETIRETGRKVDALAANAGIGLGESFLDQRRADWVKVIDTNVTGTLDLIHLVGRDMRAAGSGRILITSSIASHMPSPFLAIYSASKAFLQSFAHSIRNELKDSGVTVTALLPGATHSEVWNRAGVTDTRLGASEQKDDPAEVAKSGFNALMAGQGEVVHGLKNKVAVAASNVIPDDLLAGIARATTKPGSAK
jgi:short-subunit dehydrogenase